MKRDAFDGEGVGQCAEQRIVFAIAVTFENVSIKRFEERPIGQVPQPDSRLVHQHLVKLAGHRRLSNAGAAKEANRAAQFRQADPMEVVAQVAERRVGMIDDREATDFVVLLSQCFGHDDRQSSPRGQQADAAVGRIKWLAR